MIYVIDDYIDPDLAYLYGLIFARGSFIESRETRTLLIELEFTNLEAEGITKKVNVREALTLGVYSITNRISDIIGEEVQVHATNHSVIIKINFPRRSMVWRAMREFTNNRDSFRAFELPDFFFEFEPIIHQEFIRGIADGCGFIRPSNRDQAGYHRVYIQITNRNWKLPVQLCKLIQGTMNVPVQVIQWGHPNTREPNRIDVDENHSTWAREHQIKIFAEDFQRIGFCFEYKQDILNELAEENIQNGHNQQRLCNPLRKKPRSPKPNHPCENSSLLPEEIKGRHFNSYFEICLALGCSQGKPSPQLPIEFADDEIEEANSR